MSFWNSILQYNKQPLTQHSYSKRRVYSPSCTQSPTGNNYVIATSQEERKRIQDFLRKTFGNPPHTPILFPTFSSDDILLYVKDQENTLVGCIRYSYAGHFEEQEIYKIDCFCIEPSWRKRGIGSYLLTSLHSETMKRNHIYSIFLKEGAPVFSLQQPFYSSSYVFKKIVYPYNPMYSIYTPTLEEVYRIINTYKTVYPDTFVLISRDPIIQWRFFKRGNYILLVCCQESYQFHPEDRNKIGWITGWLESCPLTWPPDRQKILDTLVHSFFYTWLWADKRWIQDPSWKEDGTFHWYSYQWEPTLVPNGSYILNV